MECSYGDFSHEFLLRVVKGYIEEMNRDGFDYPSEIKEWYNEQLEDDCK